MNTFLALYLAPASTIEDWMKTDPATRKEAEEKMKTEWNEWMKKNSVSITDTRGLGKTKAVTAEGVADTKNGLMLYSLVQAESHEAAAALFDGHPHLQIPGASIEIMTTSPLS